MTCWFVKMDYLGMEEWVRGRGMGEWGRVGRHWLCLLPSPGGMEWSCGRLCGCVEMLV